MAELCIISESFRPVNIKSDSCRSDKNSLITFVEFGLKGIDRVVFPVFFCLTLTSVFGVPDERLGENLATRIALNPGNTATEAEISSFLEGKIAKYKIPSYMWFQEEELPRIASGKTAKKQMREDAIKQLGLG